MRIESFHIQGFKSLVDVKVEGLSDINVFYGLNNVGKSNIFQAISLWSKLVQDRPSVLHQKQTSTSIFHISDNTPIKLEVELILTHSDLPVPDPPELLKVGFDIQKIFEESSSGSFIYELTNQVTISPALSLTYENSFIVDKKNLKLKDETISFLLPNFHNIQANRRAHIERNEKNGSSLDLVTDQNIKRALFYAYLSPNLQQKRRLEAIKRILANEPFNLGELDVALDPEGDQIDIGFVQKNGRLPLENMGSGVQQLLLVLGQIFLNNHQIIAIEEPEMNLSPQYQQYLLVALRELMQDPDVTLNQLFISTHSPYFEFEENFFDVTMDEAGATHVEKLPIEKRGHYFPDTLIGPETGSRLNSAKQITLYNGVIEDLGLERGDLVLFVKNEAGHWELRPETEITHDLETMFEDK